jgi:high affinity Mn2+ porin
MNRPDPEEIVTASEITAWIGQRQPLSPAAGAQLGYLLVVERLTHFGPRNPHTGIDHAGAYAPRSNARAQPPKLQYRFSSRILCEATAAALKNATGIMVGTRRIIDVMRLHYCRTDAVALRGQAKFWTLSRGVIVKRYLAVSATLIALVAGRADAGEGGGIEPFREPVSLSPYSWTGLYIGGHLGDAWGRSDWKSQGTAAAGPTLSGSLEFYKAYDAFKGTGSYFAGFQAGYNYMLPSGIVLGVEADVSAPNTIMGAQTISSPLVGQANYAETVEYSGTIRSRLGYAVNHWLVYGTGGFAWSYDQFTRTQFLGTPAGGTAVPGTFEKLPPEWRTGWTAGAGIEVAIASNWTANIEYLFTSFGNQSVMFPAGAQRIESDLTMQSVRVGLNYQFGGIASNDSGPTTGPTAPKSDNWSVHGQTTYVEQYAFPFRAPYRGTNSLDSGAGRETWDATFYVGARLWPGAELWINPEVDQGFGLSGTLGVAGFPSAEAYKVGADYPYARLPRMFIRQTIALGDATEQVESGANQFSGAVAKDKLVITAGKFSAVDVFDNNKYAHDPRVDFLNWAIVDTGTFDYAADAWAFTYGTAVEWYKGPWTLRAGLFDLPIVPNSTDLDPHFAQFQWIGEIERRYDLWGQPGKLAFTGFLTRGRMGRFDDAVQLADLTGEPADIAAVRRYQSRTGISFNLEQQLFANVGMFVRGGTANGAFEPFAFTDIDRTIAAGVVISGEAWGHKDHTFGFAGVVNDISKDEVAYLNAGGLTALIGDGKLPHPGNEKILETYYSLPVSFWRVTADYQLITNPAYNKDRGPVSAIAARVRTQF